jgi:ABC-type glycerol-3-phosphate transport system permease component
LPAIFNTFPIILTYGGFKSIPISALEVARIDGAGEFYIFLKIGIPLGKSVVMWAVVLGFLEYWNKDTFNTAHIAGLSIEWEGGQDICPDDLYYSSKPI